MKSKYSLVVPILFFFLLHFSIDSFSQAGMWTWVHGDNIPNQAGNYGTQGIPSPLNKPRALYGPASWVDQVGNFWIFGGAGSGGNYNDLWKYDPATNEWTWMKGSGVAGDAGNYGTIGVPSPSNYPGSRAYGAASWTDLNGNLWLFGGSGTGLACGGALADLWKFDPTTNEWTWMKGNCGDGSDFGTIQVPALTNTPGMRDECTANWVSSDGGLWLFSSKRDNSALCSDDMWKYDVSLNMWIWMSGSTANSINPTYGTQKIFSPANTPGSRMNHGGWTDSDGNFWLFGGQEFFGPSYADLWKYDPIINQWAWMSASSQPNNNGSAGALCDTSHLFNPAYRFENRANWIDDDDNLWSFGGFGDGDMNDLWMYHPPCDLWSLVSGSVSPNGSGIYGTLGIPDPANIPGARGGGVAFYDNDNNLWLFGGRAC
jgi:hypothetical protein